MRNRDSLKRARKEAFRDARLMVIASEGKDTERIYFEALAKEYSNPRVHVHVLKRYEGEGNNSSPEHVLLQMNLYKKQYELEDDDELWIVVEKDRWTDAMLSHVAVSCATDCFMNLALSNPCFELWLLLHFVDVNQLVGEDSVKWLENRRVSKRGNTFLKVLLRHYLDAYHESSYDVSRLMPNVNEAINRAYQLDLFPEHRWPQKLGTRVHLLAESIMNINR